MGIGSDDLNIKLVLDAIDRMGPQIDQAVHDLDKVARAAENTQRKAQQAQIAKTGSLFDTNTWSVLMRDADAFQARMDKLQRSGMDKMVVGGAMLAPVIGAAKAAGDLEEVMNQIKVDVYDSTLTTEQWEGRTQKLRNTMVDLSREVKYSSKEIGEGLDALARANVSVDEIADGAGRAAIYLAQASKGELTTGGAAEAVAKIGNAWQLTGKELENTADMLSRVDAASTASIPDLVEGFKYVSSTASNLKLGVQDVATALGVLNNAGLDGSTAGTSLNMFLENLQPRTKEAKAMFEQLGLSVEKNPFFDTSGKLKPMAEIITIMRNATKDMTDQQKQAAFRNLFDERGARAMVNLTKEGKNSFEDVNDSLSHQMSLWDRIKTQNQGLNSQVEILKTNVTTLFAESGSPLGKELTDLVTKANQATVAFTEWTKTHPETVSGVLKVTGAVGGLTLAVGALEVAVGSMLKVWVPAFAAIKGGAAFLFGTEAGAAMLALGGFTVAGYGAYKGVEAITPVLERQSLNAKDEADYQQKLRDSAAQQAVIDAFKREGAYKYNEYGMVIGEDKEKEKAIVQRMVGSGELPYRLAGAWAPNITNNITIVARDAQDTAQQVQRVIGETSSVKYARSRLPLPVMD